MIGAAHEGDVKPSSTTRRADCVIAYGIESACEGEAFELADLDGDGTVDRDADRAGAEEARVLSLVCVASATAIIVDAPADEDCRNETRCPI